MDNEVELISDGDGLAVIGKPTAVERFMASVGLSSNAGSPRLGAAFSAGASVAQTGSEIAANSGRWVKLSKESAQAVKKFGLMDTKTPGVSHAMVGQPRDIKQWIQIVRTTPGSMQQTMAEITDYLATIDEQLDHVLRAQTNQVLARLDGVDLAVREAVSVGEAVGRVSEVTWSKVQNSAHDSRDPGVRVASARRSRGQDRREEQDRGSCRGRVHEFHELLGIESGREPSEARRWREAAAERWDKARATGAQAIDDVKRFGSETRGQAGSVRDNLSHRIAERKLRRRKDDE